MRDKQRGENQRCWLARTMILLGVLVLVFSSTLSWIITGVLQPGGIYVPNGQHIFHIGEQKGGSLKHSFRIYNFRPTTLILQAEPDCSCHTYRGENQRSDRLTT